MKVSQAFHRVLLGTIIHTVLLLCLPIGVVAQSVRPEPPPQNPRFTQWLKERAEVQQATQDASSHSLGFIPSPIDMSHLKGKRIFGRRLQGTYPSTYDLRQQGKVTAVRDQGSCGSCWAFAAMASLESTLLTDETWDLSENNINNLHGFDWGCCDGGNVTISSAYLLRWDGPVAEVDDPYKDYSCYSPSASVRKHVQNVYYIPQRESFLDNDNIKDAVMTYGGVCISFYIDGYYYNSATCAYYCDYDYGTNHEVCIVGWNDNYSKSSFSITPPGDGAFIVKNSYGTSWGESGYFYISYYDQTLGSEAAVFTAEETDSYSDIYQYDPYGQTWVFGYGDETAWFANVFTATSYAPLTAVGWYTLSPNAPYEVYVYKNPESGPITLDGYVAKKTGTISKPGYTTIGLDAPISLTKGETFSVVVKLTTPDYYWPVPTEHNTYYYSSAASANAGESYVSEDGVSWEDLTSIHNFYGYDLVKDNVCLKAYSGSPELCPPHLEITSPTMQSTYVTKLSSIDICGIASDNRAVQSVTWENTTMDTGTGACEGDVDWATWCAIGVPLKSDVPNEIVITALDGDGNTAREALTVINDGVNPTVTISSPTTSEHYFPDSSNITISGTASDNVGITGVAWSNSDTGQSGDCTIVVNGTSATWTATGIDLSISGNTNSITVTVTDQVGNTSTDVLKATPLAGVSVVPGECGLLEGTSQQFKVVAIDLGGTARPLPEGAEPAWSATSGGIDGTTGEFTSGSEPATVSVSAGGKIATVNVEVFPLDKNGGYALERWWGGNLDIPMGLAVDAAGRVCVADSGNNRIQIYDSHGTYDDQFLGTGVHPFDTPRSLAIDDEGNFYVCDTRNNRIQKYDSDWEFVTEWGSLGTGEGQFNSPNGIALDDTGCLYVADTGNNRIQKFCSEGVYLAELAPTVALHGPRDVMVVSDQEENIQYLYVADSRNNMLRKFVEKTQSELSSRTVRALSGRVDFGQAKHMLAASFEYETCEWGATGCNVEGTKDGQFREPTGVITDSAGNVYVADYRNDRIQRFDATGDFLGKWGGSGTDGGLFNQPVTMRRDANDNIYVVDTYNNRVQKFVPADELCVVILQPEEQGFTDQDWIHLSGTVSGIVSSVVWANSESRQSGQCIVDGKTWSADVPLELGSNTIVITARDFSDAYATASLRVYYQLEYHSVTISEISVSPTSVESQATASVSVEAVDSLGHDLAYTWSDGGKGGVFDNTHSATATYTAPANTSPEDLTVAITCRVECAEDSGVMDTKYTMLLVMGYHDVEMTQGPTVTPDRIDSSESVACYAVATDTRGHALLYKWSDGGAGGSFSPSANCSSPTYTAPENTSGSAKSVTLTCIAKCSQSQNVMVTGAVVLTVDDPDPSLEITGPTSDEHVTRTGPCIDISGTASADTTQIAWINAKTGESGSVAGATAWTVEGIGLEEGINLITVTAVDAGKKTAVDILEVTQYAASVADAWKGIAMVALPIIPDETDPKGVVHFFDVAWMSWETQNAYYVKYSTDKAHLSWFEPVSETPGRGFWARFAGSVATPCGTVPDQTQDATIHLYKGWNLVGQPFLNKVDWNLSTIKVKTTSGVVASLQDSQSYVQTYAWGWEPDASNPITGEYYLIADPAAINCAVGELEPWRAYWLKAKQECYLIIPAP